MKKFALLALWAICFTASAAKLAEGDAAPGFTVKTHLNTSFSLSERAGFWTVLYFYPKADTPGCTAQACGFKGAIEEIRQLNADVFGVSSDDVAALAAFHAKYDLNFLLLADPTLSVINAYGVKSPSGDVAKRWTFLIDPQLRIRHIETNVDPVLDAEHVIEKLKELQGTR